MATWSQDTIPVEETNLLSDKVAKEIEVGEGKIKIATQDLLSDETDFVGVKAFVGLMEEAKNKAKVLSTEDNPKKVELLSKGFMFQAGKTQAGDEPFYLEIHLIGEDQYAVSAGKNGILSRDDVKALRKNLKSVMNHEKELYLQKDEAPKKGGAAANWSPEDAYPDPDYEDDEVMDFDDYDGDAEPKTKLKLSDYSTMPFVPAGATEDDIPF